MFSMEFYFKLSRKFPIFYVRMGAERLPPTQQLFLYITKNSPHYELLEEI
jgi:hypothetical protein